MRHLKYLGVTVILLLLFPSSAFSQAERDYSYRPLHELDQLSTGEAYAWISNNGLRIYYTAFDDINGVYAIWTSQRRGTDQNFRTHQKLAINSIEKDNISAWLDDEEKTIAFVRRTTEGTTDTEIHIAQRDSKNDDFENSEALQLVGGVKGTILSPSFTQDLEQLIFFNEYKGRSYILVFKKTGHLEYSFDYQLSFPKRYHVKTGKLSTDGLEYYVSIQYGTKKPSLYTFKRTSTDKAFSEMIEMPDVLINDPDCRNHQHYFSSNKNFIVFTRSKEDRWSSNSIFIARNKNFKEQSAEEVSLTSHLDDIIMYPNPSIENIYFKNVEAQSYTILMYNESGQLVKQFRELADDQAVHIADMAPGAYYFKFIDNTTGHFRLIKHIKLR